LKFNLKSNFQPTGDQPDAIAQLVRRVQENKRHSTLLGVTGSGKTFTMANIIQQVQRPTLIIAHNKTLAAQLYQEFRDFFPDNAVSYFVSYYDYYQPEAYIPTTDTYIEKEATINDEIDKLRLASTTNLLTRPDSIVIASVSCIYNLGSPVEYGKYILQLVEGEIISREALLGQLQNLQYDRSDHEFRRGTFRVRGDIIQLWPAYEEKALRIDTLENQITAITWIDPLTGTALAQQQDHLSSEAGDKPRRFVIYPAKHYMMNPKSQEDSFKEIQADLAQQLNTFKQEGKVVEAYRLEQKVNYDLEMMKEFGFVNGIENYSRYFDGREPGDPPFTLIDYFDENSKSVSHTPFLTIIDESHMTLPQIKGMHNGDRARKETLIDYGFRLPSALDNRPLTFDEFLDKTQNLLHVSATPNELEVSLSGQVVEQLIRPTGLVDPQVELRPTEGQIEDLVIEIIKRKLLGQRTLVTTLTKKMAEALTEYLNDQHKIDQLVKNFTAKTAARKLNLDPDQIIWQTDELPIDQMEIGPIEAKFFSAAESETIDPQQIDYPKVAYLHSEIETFERSDILDDLRKGVYDVVVGINLLREGLDLPEVTLVAILDADKEGFLRSRTSLIQTMGRAARHQLGHTILYADRMTGSMKAAIEETQRRRKTQVEYNIEHNITPITISKPIRQRMIKKTDKPKKGRRRDRSLEEPLEKGLIIKLSKSEQIDLSKLEPAALTPDDRKKLATKLNRRMNTAAKDMDFELAAILRDVIKQL
jgi:excinuclease ABC subunit B